MPIYEEKEKVNGQKRYYIRTYITDEYGNKKQITRHNKSWIGRDGHFEAQQEEIRIKSKKTVMLNKNILFKNVADDFLKSKDKKKESTYYTYENAISCIISKMPFYLNSINKYTSKDNEYFRNYMENSNYKLQYKNKLHNIMNGILDIAVNKYGLDKNYERITGSFTERNEKEIKDQEKIKYITYDDFIVVLNNVNDEFYKLIYFVLFYTGMRKGELMALNWNDIDFDNSLIKVSKTYTNKTREGTYKITNTKNLQNRVIELDSETKNKLFNYFKKQKRLDNFSMNDFVFGGNKPISTTTLRNKWEKAFDGTQIQYIKIHELRHSHVSFLSNEYVKKGNTDTTKFFLKMANRMGHTLKVMMETYMHLFPGFQSEIVSLIEDTKLKQDQKQD